MKKKLVIPMVLSSTLLAGSFVPSVAAETTTTENGPRISVEKQWNEKANVPVFVKEKRSAKRAASNEADALEYLEENGEKLGINNPKANLKASKIKKDELGMTHVRFNQTENGVPVEGAEVIVHYSADNEIIAVNGSHNPIAERVNVDTNPAISATVAIDTAKSAVDAPAGLNNKPNSKLVVYPFEGNNHLVYKVNVNFLGDTPGNWFVFVDAKTGDVVDKYNALMHNGEEQAISQTGVGTGVLGDKRSLHLTKTTNSSSGAKFQLADFSHPGLEGIFTLNYNNDTGAISVFSGKDAAFKDDYDRAAVDAHFNSETVYDYYKDEHGRNSLDGEGMAIQSVVHYGNNYNNAFWNGRYMVYGDGDGEFMNTLSAGLDVAAHEMTHGVTTHTAGLVYEFQSGALNEAFSDIFAAIIDSEDWEVGEDIMASAAKADGRVSLRSLSDPGKYSVGEDYAPYGNGEGTYPSHMDEYYDLPYELDNGGVHINSSIINHAAYLTGVEIGREKLGQIYYRALSVYLTPNADFSAARKAIIQSAEDIYGEGSAEVKAAASGFDQVGIYE